MYGSTHVANIPATFHSSNPNMLQTWVEPYRPWTDPFDTKGTVTSINAQKHFTCTCVKIPDLEACRCVKRKPKQPIITTSHYFLRATCRLELTPDALVQCQAPRGHGRASVFAVPLPNAAARRALHHA